MINKVFSYRLPSLSLSLALSQRAHEAGPERHHGSDRKRQIIVSVFVKSVETRETFKHGRRRTLTLIMFACDGGILAVTSDNMLIEGV